MSQDNEPHLDYIDVNIRSRDIYSILKKIKPYIGRYYSLYTFMDTNKLFQVLVLGKPRTRYVYRKKKDLLSGLTYNIKEACIQHYGRTFIHINWNGSQYRLKIIYSPITIKIIGEIQPIKHGVEPS